MTELRKRISSFRHSGIGMCLAGVIFALCKRTSRQRHRKRHIKPLWEHCCESLFGQCHTYSGLGDTEVTSATEQTPETLQQTMRRSHNRMLDAEHGGADRKGRRGCGRKNSGVVGRSVGDDDEEEHEEEDETSQRVEDKGSMPVATSSRSRSRSAAAGPRVPKLPPPVVKDLSNVDLTQQQPGLQMKPAMKVQAMLNRARATQLDEGPAEKWFEPFADAYMDVDENRSEVLTLVFPHDSISMAGVQPPPPPPSTRAVLSGGREAGRKKDGRNSSLPRSSLPGSIRQLGEYRHAPERVTSVYMHTSSGQRFTAKVDVEGIASTDELLRGLRAAYCHYTNEPSPPYGSLLTTVVLGLGKEVHLMEDVAAQAMPPLPGLLPCSHFVMQGCQTALLAAQQHHLRSPGAAYHRAPLMALERWPAPDEPPALGPTSGDVRSLPVALPRRGSAGAGRSTKVATGQRQGRAKR